MNVGSLREIAVCELRLWDLAPDQAEPRDRLVTAAGPHEMFIQPVLFSPQGTLLHARIVGAEQRLHEHATDGRLLRVLYKTKKDPVTALARAVDSAAWAAGFLSGDVATSAGPNRPMARLGREGAEVTCLAFGPANRLLLTSVMEAGQAQLELWDVSPGAARRLERRSLGALDHAYALCDQRRRTVGGRIRQRTGGTSDLRTDRTGWNDARSSAQRSSGCAAGER